MGRDPAGEKRLLSMVAQGDLLPEVLGALCRIVEDAAPGRLCSVLWIDPDGVRFRHGAGPSLPAASIAHEVNQPLSGIITNANTCLKMLAADPPNVLGAQETARRTVRDGNRAADIINRLRSLFGKRDPTSEPVDLNDAAREIIALSWSDLQRGRVTVRAELAEDLPLVMGDRVQLQQVILNLLLNAADAMSGVDDRPRQAVIKTERLDSDSVGLAVQDVGVGLSTQSAEKLFEAFYTTKSDGMGIGLSISRSIIENHGGRLWARPNDGPGVTFAFSVPCTSEAEPAGSRAAQQFAADDPQPAMVKR